MLGFILSITPENKKERVREIYEKFHDDMFRFARKKLLGKSNNLYDDAEDVVQSSFMKILKYTSINFYAPDKQLKVYIFSVVVNEINNLLNERFVYEDISEYECVLSDEEFYEKINIRENFSLVVKKMEILEEKYRLTLYYYYVEEMKVRDIAKMMGLPEKTVYTRLERGKRQLLHLIEEEENIK